MMGVRRHDGRVTYVELCNELGEGESYIAKNEREQRRKRGKVRAVFVKERQGREVGIHEDAYPNPYDHDHENGEVDAETKH